MRRLVVALFAAVALAGCGGDSSPSPDPGPAPKLSEKRVDEVQQALDKLDETDLPEDAREELEEAKRLLDEARG